MAVFAVGLKTLYSLCTEQSTLDWHRAKLGPKLFKGSEVAVHAWIHAHVTKHHQLPKIETLNSKFPETLGVQTPEPSSYYIELLENQYFYGLINQANLDSQQLLKTDQNAHEQAMVILKNAVDAITMQKYRTQILDVGLEAPEMVYKAYHSLLSSEVDWKFGWPHMDHDGGVQPGDVISLVGRPAQGKAQPLSAKVLTNTGFTTMGELKIGDSLASVDGAPSMVSGVFPQGVKPVYRIEFTDGRSTEASDEHLWEVFYREWETPKVLTTLQLISKLKHTRYKKRLSVRYFSGVWGLEKQFTVSPYLMGFLLGDGCFRGNTLTFSSADEELVQRVKDEVSVLGCVITYRNGYDYAINCEVQTKNPITANLRDAGLWGKTSNEKYIPRDYLDTCEDQRWELLRGLMDTDGTAGKDGQATFCTTSMILAKQVQELVRGLGGRASIRIKTTTSLDAFIVGIVINDRARLFHLERKKNRVLAERSRHKQVRLVIDSIAYVGEKECQCISVSHPSHLYITDDYIVTHNTFQMLYIAIYNWLKGHNVLFVSMEMTLLPLAQRIVAMYAHTNITQLKKPGYSNLPKGNSIYDKFKTGLSLMGKEKAKFYVVDGNLAASAEDVYVLADQLKCKLIYVDGAYLMRHKNSKLDRFTRAAENVELMKRYCTDMGAATFSSWQFNRDAVKGKKKTDPQGGLEDIGYTDAIGQISSIVLGLFQDDGVETMKQRVIRVLKGRNGEVGQFNVNWLFNVMDFSQVQTASEESKKQLEYL